MGKEEQSVMEEFESFGETQFNEELEKYSTYNIKTDGFEQVLVGAFHMIQTVTLGTKCRIVLDYDPALLNVTIETFIDKSDVERVREKPHQWVPYDSMQQ
ncbi:hypothetical protein [Schaedlerella sp.]|uniref:hypothetical protein n=1 Tax=Schaedlerella sp. TaxID=2676057 RepID=UPI0037473B34